jgi:hypothetical protein
MILIQANITQKLTSQRQALVFEMPGKGRDFKSRCEGALEVFEPVKCSFFALMLEYCIGVFLLSSSVE